MLIIFYQLFSFFDTRVVDPQSENPDPIQDLEVYDNLYSKIFTAEKKYIFMMVIKKARYFFCLKRFQTPSLLFLW